MAAASIQRNPIVLVPGQPSNGVCWKPETDEVTDSGGCGKRAKYCSDYLVKARAIHDRSLHEPRIDVREGHARMFLRERLTLSHNYQVISYEYKNSPLRQGH